MKRKADNFFWEERGEWLVERHKEHTHQAAFDGKGHNFWGRRRQGDTTIEGGKGQGVQRVKEA